MFLLAEAVVQIFFQPARRAEVKRRRVRQLVAPKSYEGGSFAGVRVQALPFFQRRGIRQRDGEKFTPLFRALDFDRSYLLRKGSFVSERRGFRRF